VTPRSGRDRLCVEVPMKISGIAAVVAIAAAAPTAGNSGAQTLLEDADALIDQALTRLLHSSEAMAFEIGKCSLVYPNASTNPYVIKARQERSEINDESLSRQIERAESIGFAEGLQAAPASKATVRECAGGIEDRATEIENHTAGLLDLARRIDAASREQ